MNCLILDGRTLTLNLYSTLLAPGLLCPVNNIQLYLNCSEPLSVGPLFTSRSGTPLTVFMLSRLICRIVLKAVPASRIKVLDIQKFASSFSSWDL